MSRRILTPHHHDILQDEHIGILIFFFFTTTCTYRLYSMLKIKFYLPFFFHFIPNMFPTNNKRKLDIEPKAQNNTNAYRIPRKERKIVIGNDRYRHAHVAPSILLPSHGPCRSPYRASAMERNSISTPGVAQHHRCEYNNSRRSCPDNDFSFPNHRHGRTPVHRDRRPDREIHFNRDIHRDRHRPIQTHDSSKDTDFSLSHRLGGTPAAHRDRGKTSPPFPDDCRHGEILSNFDLQTQSHGAVNVPTYCNPLQKRPPCIPSSQQSPISNILWNNNWEFLKYSPSIISVSSRIGSLFTYWVTSFLCSEKVLFTQKLFVDSFLFVVGVTCACIQTITHHCHQRKSSIGELSILRLKKPSLFEMSSNKCFVFEEVHDSFFKDNVSARLEKLGPLHSMRISKYVKRLHILMESDHCGYIVKHASGCHYEVQFGQVVTANELNPCKYNIYYPDTNYSNDFLHIIANQKDIRTYTDQVDWNVVQNRLSSSDTSNSSTRQKFSAGYGYTGGQCNTYEDTTNQVGVSEPRLRANTKDQDILNLFQLMTTFSTDNKPQWLPKHIDLWSDPKHPNRTQNFANKITTGNAIESLYFGKTNDLHPCGCHTDGLNPSPMVPSLSAVSVLSHVTDLGDRISLIGTMRLAVDRSLQSVSQVDQVITDIKKFITSLEPCKTKISFDTFNGLKFEGFPGYSSTWGTCPIDPISFFQVYLYYIPLVAEKYHLSFLEVVSLQTCFDFYPKSPYYFGCTAEMLLGSKNQDICTLSGAYFGFYFIRLMEAVLKISEGKTPCRFSDYRDTSNRFPSDYSEFQQAVYNKVKLCIHVQCVLPHEPSDPSNSYKKVVNLFVKTVRGAGYLTCNHSLGMMACLGVMPKWIVHQCHIPRSSKFMKSIFKDYDLGDINERNIDSFVNRVSRFLAHCCNMEPTPRLIENLLCKFYRHYNVNSQENVWKDCIMEKQETIVRVTNQSKVIHLHRCTSKKLIETDLPLISSFACGKESGNLADLVQSCHLSSIKKFPKLEKLFSFELPDTVCYNHRNQRTTIAKHMQRKSIVNNNKKTEQLVLQVYDQCDFHNIPMALKKKLTKNIDNNITTPTFDTTETYYNAFTTLFFQEYSESWMSNAC